MSQETEAGPELQTAPPRALRRALGNPYACRLFFFVLAVMEIADFVSDILWLLSVVTYEAFHENGYDDDDLVYRYDEGKIAICFCTVGFFALSTTLLFGKLFDDLRHIFASNGNAHHPYKRLEVFGLNIFYLLTLSNDDISAAYSQRSAAHDADKANLWDCIFGLHRPDNHLDESYPLLASVVVPDDFSARSPSTKLWEVMAYPIALTFSEGYFHALPLWLAYLLWPIAALLSILSVISLFLVGLGNMFAKSKHSYTIRIFEDMPQLAINVAYLASPFGRGRANYFSLLSLVLSGIMLSKFAMEVGYEACTTTVPCQLVRRRVAVPRQPSATHTVCACFASPIMGIMLAPFFFLWFLSEGLASFVGGLCGCSCCIDLSDWAPVDSAEETTLRQLPADDAPAGAYQEPLLAQSAC